MGVPERLERGIDNLLDVITGNVFAGLTQLLFDGGRTRAQIAAAEAIAAAAEAAEAAEVSLTRPRLPFRFWFRLRTGRDGAIVFGLPVR